MPDTSSFVPRLHHRFRVSLPVDVLHPRFVGKGQIANVSLRGWRILGQVQVEPGDQIILRLTIGDSDKLALDVRTIVRWIREEAFGVEVLGYQPTLEARVRKWIHSLGPGIRVAPSLSGS